jgi:hypothetical protein
MGAALVAALCLGLFVALLVSLKPDAGPISIRQTWDDLSESRKDGKWARWLESEPDSQAEAVDSGALLGLMKRDKEFQRRAAFARRDIEASARFSAGVRTGRYTAKDIRPEVRSFFANLELVPVLHDGGDMSGLEIRSIKQGKDAGFLKPDDQIISIDSQNLSDPGLLPTILVQMNPSFQVCVKRNEREICDRLQLSAQ